MPAELPLVPGFISRLIENWAARRLPRPGDHTTLVRQRIYILPTRAGVAFFVVLLVILFGAINYENSLAFMLSFLLGAIGFLGMMHTHQNLNHLGLSVLPAAPVFAGQTASFPLLLSAPASSRHLNIQFRSGDGEVTRASVTGGVEARAQVSLPAHRRGRLHLPRVRVYTEFPLGLFHAWSWVELQSQCLVYPQPDARAARFQYGGRQSGNLSSMQAGNDDFAGIRDYHKGDSPMHLAWKAIARTGELQTKQFHAEAGNEIWLSWYRLPDSMDTEQRLSVLCRWILEADRQGLRYGLEIPGYKSVADSGLQHRHRCLKQLALFGEAGP